jgi:hypothetical protein
VGKLSSWGHRCVETPTVYTDLQIHRRGVGGAADATAFFALAVRENLNQLLKQHGLHRTRIFFYGPSALAVFLGQKLTSVGEIQLFEYQDPGYVPSCSLRT